MQTSARFQQRNNAPLLQECLPDEKYMRFIEDDSRSCALKDKPEKRHQRWYQFYDKTIGEGLTEKKGGDPIQAIHPLKANLREEARTSLKTEGSNRKASDPDRSWSLRVIVHVFHLNLSTTHDRGMSDSLPRKT